MSAAKRNDRAATRDGRALQMYTLLTQILTLLSHLVEMQELTDVFVLEVSKLVFPAHSMQEIVCSCDFCAVCKLLKVRRVMF